MKKILLLIVLIIIFISCFKNTSSSSNDIIELIIISDKKELNADGKDLLNFIVEGKTESGKLIDLSNVKVYKDKDLIENSFKTLIEGEYNISAEYQGFKSNTILIKAMHSEDFVYKGADISFLPELEDNNVKFKNLNNEEENLIKILKNNELNTIRLRLWVDNEYCNLEKTLYMARKIKAEGLNLLLDFHYSDTWADPGSQTKPSSWKDLTFNELNETVYNYTLDVMNKLKEQGTPPQLVQIGNEINTGILKPEGDLETNSWDNFSNLIKSGIKAVKDSNENVKIILHIADYNNANWFFDNIKVDKDDFDIIGLSYYPWWHGKDLSNLAISLNNISERYNKEIMIIETAYPWTFKWNDWTNNVAGDDSKIIEDYPATVQGQKEFLSKLLKIIREIPNNKGNGLFYWAPEWVSFKGDEAKDASTWENLTLFDFQNKVLESIEVFKE